MRQRPRSQTVSTLLLAGAVALGAAGCADKELTPQEQRSERVEKRLKLSFSDEQVACMMARFDDDVLIALDRETGLPEGQAMVDYTTVARECVVGEGTVSTTAPTSSTVADADDPAGSTAPADTTDATDPADATTTTGDGGDAPSPTAGD